MESLIEEEPLILQKPNDPWVEIAATSMTAFIETGIIGIFAWVLLQAVIRDVREDIRSLTKTIMDFGILSSTAGEKMGKELSELRLQVQLLLDRRNRNE